MSNSIAKAWEFDDGQSITMCGREYNIHACILLATDIDVEEIPIRHIDRSSESPCDDTFMSFVSHVKSVVDADTTKPILMNEFGAVIDGRHRIAKALLDGDETIKCKQFLTDPPACYTEVDI